MTFGAFISTRRKEAKLNLRDTAKHLGISNGYLCDIEQGRRPAPEGAFVERISSFLELDKQEHEMLLDLAADSRQTVPADLPDYISGLEARNRDDFNRMMTDCREGKIDRVLCKSISRFARNTQEYIQFVRELLRLGISIHFEKENIDTGKMTSEQVAQIYGAFAQMESTNHSSNMRFSVRMRMEKGLFVPSSVPYGYRLAGRDLEIIPEEAEVVRRIFSAYLSGQGKDDIARELNQLGVDRGRNREKWYPSTGQGGLRPLWRKDGAGYQIPWPPTLAV